ncbi:MAG: AMP-binding protein [Desulfuromonadaceae bacterium]
MPPGNTLQTIGELFSSQVAAYGNNPFLILPESDETVTFSQAAETSSAVQKLLIQHGFVSGDRVALILPNGKEAALSLLSVMSAGGVAVPLNPRLTADEIGQALRQSSARFVIFHSEWSHARECGSFGFSPEAHGTVHDLQIGLLSRSSEAAGFTAVAARVSSWSAALILFTSGTTGTPKGVLLSHGNLLENASFVRTAHQLTSDDIALCVLALFHINGLVVTLLTPLLTGMAVVIPERFAAEHFWRWVADHRVTWFSAVPTILSLLLSHSAPEVKDTASLRFARSASAPLPVAILEEFEQRFRVPVIETYGISEAACQVTANPLPPLLHKPGSAGLPVGNQLRVVDEQGAELPQGEVGEVVLRGKNVFRGYLDNEKADREALKGGWFYTGDLGFLDEEGYLFLTGRKKELINRAGEKISPREVEEVIHRLPQVEAVGVVGVPHQLYGEEVTAFVTLRPGSDLDANSIRRFCREHLAGFKTPREVFFIEEFPKGPSGKIQRRRLVDIYGEIKKKGGLNEKNL